MDRESDDGKPIGMSCRRPTRDRIDRYAIVNATDCVHLADHVTVITPPSCYGRAMDKASYSWVNVACVIFRSFAITQIHLYLSQSCAMVEAINVSPSVVPRYQGRIASTRPVDLARLSDLLPDYLRSIMTRGGAVLGARRPFRLNSKHQ